MYAMLDYFMEMLRKSLETYYDYDEIIYDQNDELTYEEEWYVLLYHKEWCFTNSK